MTEYWSFGQIVTACVHAKCIESFSIRLEAWIQWVLIKGDFYDANRFIITMTHVFGSERRNFAHVPNSFGNFFWKRVKKLNSKKGADLQIFEKWVPSVRSTCGRRGAGDLLPIQRAGGSKTFSGALPRASCDIQVIRFIKIKPWM
jgi:hypothetical protein